MKSPRRRHSAQEHSRRHLMLVAARDRMLERGYAATTVDDICEAAAVTKGAFFHHFDSKEAMAREVLDRFIEGLFAPMSFARDPRTHPDPLRRLRGVLKQVAAFYESLAAGPGCLIGLFTMELGVLNPAIRRRCAKAFRVMRDGIARELRTAIDQQKAREHGRGRGCDLDPERLAEGVVAAVQGGEILARATNDPGRLRKVLKQQFSLLEGAILGSESPDPSQTKTRQHKHEAQ